MIFYKTFLIIKHGVNLEALLPETVLMKNILNGCVELT